MSARRSASPKKPGQLANKLFRTRNPVAIKRFVRPIDFVDRRLGFYVCPLGERPAVVVFVGLQKVSQAAQLGRGSDLPPVLRQLGGSLDTDLSLARPGSNQDGILGVEGGKRPGD